MVNGVVVEPTVVSAGTTLIVPIMRTPTGATRTEATTKATTTRDGRKPRLKRTTSTTMA